jgi:hypothetical protein
MGRVEERGSRVSSQVTVAVSLGQRSYDIVIGAGLIARAASTFSSVTTAAFTPGILCAISAPARAIRPAPMTMS